MANIHRNILLEQMHDYAANMEQGGELWISGFYEQDIPALVAEAERQGLQYYCTRANGEWRMLMLIKH
jgi:ribosomal protein L11 methyltransferase